MVRVTDLRITTCLVDVSAVVEIGSRFFIRRTPLIKRVYGGRRNGTVLILNANKFEKVRVSWNVGSVRTSKGHVDNFTFPQIRRITPFGFNLIGSSKRYSFHNVPRFGGNEKRNRLFDGNCRRISSYVRFGPALSTVSSSLSDSLFPSS